MRVAAKQNVQLRQRPLGLATCQPRTRKRVTLPHLVRCHPAGHLKVINRQFHLLHLQPGNTTSVPRTGTGLVRLHRKFGCSHSRLRIVSFKVNQCLEFVSSREIRSDPQNRLTVLQCHRRLASRKQQVSPQKLQKWFVGKYIEALSQGVDGILNTVEIEEYSGF